MLRNFVINSVVLHSLEYFGFDQELQIEVAADQVGGSVNTDSYSREVSLIVAAEDTFEAVQAAAVEDNHILEEQVVRIRELGHKESVAGN